LRFPLQKLLTHEAAIVPVIARSGEQLARQEQRDHPPLAKWLGGDEDVIRWSE
jgi:hypothetical protein